MGDKQRQAAEAVGHGLIGDGDGARFHQAFGLRLVGREVQIGEQHLAVAQTRDLGRLRLLDLDDHVGLGEHLGAVGRDARADRLIVAVVETAAGAGVVLDQHLVALVDQLAHARRHQADPELECLDLLRHADAHGVSPSGLDWPQHEASPPCRQRGGLPRYSAADFAVAVAGASRLSALATRMR